MIIRIVLIALIVVITVWFLTNRTATRIKAWKKLLIAAFFAFAVFSVVLPGTTTDLANALGVGRGADLLLYALTLLFLSFALNQYMHNKDEQKRLVALARRVALLEAELSPHNRDLRGERGDAGPGGGEPAPGTAGS